MREGKTEEQFLLKRREIRKTKLRKFFQERLERFNLTSKGTLVKAGCQEKASGRVLLFERELSMTSPDYRLTSPDYRLDFLPVVVVRFMSEFLIGCLQDVERRVAEVLPLSPGNAAHGRAGNHGLSLGLTVAPGGRNSSGGGGGWS
jgi:hypothetical protein